MTPEREILERQLKEFEARKKAAKGVDDQVFVESARKTVSTIRAIARVPNDGELTGWQVSSFCWSLYAIASKSQDGEESRACLAHLVAAYRKKIDSAQFWGDARGAEFGRTLFNAIVLLLYRIVKDANEGAEEGILKRVGKDYLEMLALRAEAFLDDVAFKKDPVTDEQRAAMERSTGKRIRLRFWPSLAERAFGLMNRCLKVDVTLVPSPELTAFLGRCKDRGDWLGFYCANARVRRGDFAGARQLLLEVVRKKRRDAWAWTHLAEACRDMPEKAVSCYCKALTCPVRDPSIAQATVAKTRRQLACVLLAMGRVQEATREKELADRKEMPDPRDTFYLGEAKAAEQMVFGSENSSGAGRMQGGLSTGEKVHFSGVLVKRAGNAFGFVKDGKRGDVFIPPRFAERKRDGEVVTGWAAYREDRKKNRMSLCMIGGGS